MIRILKAIAVVFNATVLTMFGFFAFMVIDDGQAGSITLAENIELIDSKPPNIVPVSYTHLTLPTKRIV